MHPLDAAVVRRILPLACIVGATITAVSGQDGWGWMLFVAVLLS